LAERGVVPWPCDLGSGYCSGPDKGRDNDELGETSNSIRGEELSRVGWVLLEIRGGIFEIKISLSPRRIVVRGVLKR